jgi:hypothetical protein
MKMRVADAATQYERSPKSALSAEWQLVLAREAENM